MSTTDESILKEFLAESLDHLDGIEDSLLQIEADGANIDEELVNKVFRAVHTIKGGAGFLNLQKISQVCHAQE
ncbi:MAG TPA: Hpt domain-containing protein, partial [Fibrobacteraceae bacterium]|nr:Hpt domain-containing protein [Fibrobacteraceae bacterium]